MKNTNTQGSPEEERLNLDEYVALQRELDELKAQSDEGKKEGKLSRLISGYFERRDAREKVTVNKKKHLLLAIFLGWAGAHRFQAKRWKLGLVYLLTCWSGFSTAMTIVDILEIIPMPADENGDIQI